MQTKRPSITGKAKFSRRARRAYLECQEKDPDTFRGWQRHARRKRRGLAISEMPGGDRLIIRPHFDLLVRGLRIEECVAVAEKSKVAIALLQAPSNRCLCADCPTASRLGRSPTHDKGGLVRRGTGEVENVADSGQALTVNRKSAARMNWSEPADVDAKRALVRRKAGFGGRVQLANEEGHEEEIAICRPSW